MAFARPGPYHRCYLGARREEALEYRVYKLNHAGRIMSGEWIHAESDAEARARAHAMCDDVTPTVELWSGPRRLAILPCKDDQAA